MSPAESRGRLTPHTRGWTNADALPLVDPNPAYCVTAAGSIVIADHAFNAAYDDYVERARAAVRGRGVASPRYRVVAAASGRRITGASRGRSTALYP